MPQEHFRIAPQASGETRHDQIFQVTPGIEDRSDLLQLKGASWASLDTGRVTVTEIALHHLIGQGIVRYAGVWTGQGAELTVHTLVLVPFHNAAALS
jgi:hypothetical protein